MNIQLTGKTAVVCGSSQGIGYAVAQELAQLGANVVLVARNVEKLHQAMNTLDTSQGQKHNFLVADFTEPTQLEEIITDFASENNVHILVNNTGGPNPGKAIDAEYAEFIAAFQSHLICNHILVQALVPKMKEIGYGRIINIISTSVKQPLPNLGVSNTIRGAVGNWSKTLANELGIYNITVNNVLPGATETGRLEQIIHNKAQKTGTTDQIIKQEMMNEIPMKRLGKPEEIAAAVAFLASPAASYINGINVPVDGGRTMCL